MKQQKPKIPSHLRKPTQEWMRGILAEYELESHHVRLLVLACESWDRCCQAREGIKKHGLVFTTAGGEPKCRPEVAVERDARLAFARLIRELALDVDSPAEPYRRSPSIPANAHLRNVP